MPTSIKTPLSALAVGMLLGFVSGPLVGGQTGKGTAPEPKVLAFYYSWYRGAGSESWCLPRTRQRKAPHNPVLGDYASSDLKVIRQHLTWAKQAAIDGLICSWWGKDLPRTRAFELMLKEAEKQDDGIKICVYYETVLTPRETDELRRTAGPKRSEVRRTFGIANRVVGDMRYIVDTYGRSPAYFKVDGKPVIFIYNQAVAEANGYWKEIITGIRKERDVFLNVEGPIIPAFQKEVFDIVDSHHFYAPLHLPPGISEDVKDTPERRRKREGALRLIGKARESGRIIALPVVPGCDTSLCYPDKDPLTVKRNNGDHYRKVWDETLSLKPDWITINSFNEWPEGSEIEPSRECGDLYLKLTKEYAEAFRASKKAGSVAAPKEAEK